MSTITKHELNMALIDVRKAYRLLYSYQRRMLDTVKFISDTLSINVQSGWSIYSGNSPKNGGKLHLDSWAWDWLNMYMYEFHFGEQTIGDDKFQFAIMLQSDTGPYDSDRVKIGTEVDLFAPVEEAETKVIFQVGKNRWKAEEYGDNPIFTSKTSSILKEVEGDHKFFMAKSYPLSDLIDEEAILSTLDDFINLTNEMNMKGFFEQYSSTRN
jgi:hypothetical protein